MSVMIGDPPRTSDPSRLAFQSKVVKVIGTDTDRWATYDLLLVILTNHGPTSYRFRDKRRFRSKIAKKILTTVYFNAPAERITLENFVTAVALKNQCHASTR